jgi:hypothetical protein
MPYPNTVLSAWQLAVIALVAVGTLTAWLVAVFLAARPSRRADQGAQASPAVRPGAAGTGQPATADEPEPARQAGRREAA